MTVQPLSEPIPFGERYWLTALLAVGGMAEIYQARQAAMAGFEKDVVIKRLKPALARDPGLVEMFLDEARICAVLNHPNVVHVFDVDMQDGVPYIAMEHIRGEELNSLCRRGLLAGRFLPIRHALELMRQAAAGLGHVHTRRDNNGQPLQIVHCDISPSNLLVTEDGFLEIIDFGIARAKNQTFRDHTSVPGKLSYMSPEQASRSIIDHRSDIFALGVVLYEITVGRRLFKGPASEVIERLLACDIAPPTFIRRDFPPALEAIIMRALERHPSDRYHSAYDLADHLEDFLREANLHTGPVRIARYLDELTIAEGGERRPELITEAEYLGIEDELDFERGMFDTPAPTDRAAPTGHAELPAGAPVDRTDRADTQHEDERTYPSAWDEYDESDAHVAAALGIDIETFQRMLTPVPQTGFAQGPDEPTPVPEL